MVVDDVPTAVVPDAIRGAFAGVLYGAGGGAGRDAVLRNFHGVLVGALSVLLVGVLLGGGGGVILALEPGRHGSILGALLGVLAGLRQYGLSDRIHPAASRGSLHLVTVVVGSLRRHHHDAPIRQDVGGRAIRGGGDHGLRDLAPARVTHRGGGAACGEQIAGSTAARARLR